MSIHYGQFCPVTKAAEIVGERWTIPIIRELLLGTTRFTDFQRALSQISPTLLTKRLGELQDHGIVVKKPLPGQRRSEYHLTPAGRELGPIVMGLGEWGMRWARGQMSDDELDIEMLMFDLKRRLNPAQLPGGRTVVKFHYPELERFSLWWIIVEADGSRELCVNNPGKSVDLTITCNARTMAAIWIGDLQIGDAKRNGQLSLQGNPVLARSLNRWLGISTLAHVRPATGTGQTGSGH